MASDKIETLSQLYTALDMFYHDIEASCIQCQDPDCLGYVWLLASEAERLYNLGVPIVQINNGPNFIHSFSEDTQGRLGISEPYPRCSQVCANERRCSIHDDRPLSCRLYPIAFETKADGTTVWTLHLDCLYARNMIKRDEFEEFKRRANVLIDSLTPGLLAEIIQTYRAVYMVSAFPNGENAAKILREEGGDADVEVQGNPRR